VLPTFFNTNIGFLKTALIKTWRAIGRISKYRRSGDDRHFGLSRRTKSAEESQLVSQIAAKSASRSRNDRRLEELMMDSEADRQKFKRKQSACPHVRPKITTSRCFGERERIICSAGYSRVTRIGAVRAFGLPTYEVFNADASFMPRAAPRAHR